MRSRSTKFFLAFLLLFSGANLFCQPENNGGAKIYRGLRISLFGFKVLDQSDRTVILRCNAVNTGRDPVSFGRDKHPPGTLIVELDTMNLPTRLFGREADVVSAFYGGKISLTPGQLQQGITLKINEKEAKITPVPEPKNLTETPAEKPKPEKEIIQKPLEVTPLAPAEKRCADLVFDTVFILKQSSKSMRLHYVIRNMGEGTARLLGATDKKEDNLAVNVYFVLGQKLTRGSILADGMFLRDKDTNNGLLLPGNRLHGEIEISLRERTRFQPNLMFELDPFQSLTDECDKTNNTRALVMPIEQD